MLIMLFSEELITKVCEWLVYPLCAILFLFSLYLIPQWSFESFSAIPGTKEFITIVWLTLPVLVFSFNHSPAISTFSLSVKREYPENSVQKQIKFCLEPLSCCLLLLCFLWYLACFL